MPSYNADAIVIRRLNYSETDKILTLYSRERGRFSAIAKGARKTISRLSGATELLTCTTFNLATGKTMDVVTQTQVRESFPRMRSDLIRLAHGLYLADLVDHSVEDHEPNPALFDLLLAGLYLVQRAPSPEMAARWFDLRLLDDLGYAPDLDLCALCRENVVVVSEDDRETRYALSASQGGIVCNLHMRRGFDDHSPLVPATLNFLRNLEQISVPDGHSIVQLAVPAAIVLDQASLALRRYLRFRLERELKSLAFLDGLRHADA